MTHYSLDPGSTHPSPCQHKTVCKLWSNLTSYFCHFGPAAYSQVYIRRVLRRNATGTVTKNPLLPRTPGIAEEKSQGTGFTQVAQVGRQVVHCMTSPGGASVCRQKEGCQSQSLPTIGLADNGDVKAGCLRSCKGL